MIKDYVRFFYPGIFFSEDSSRELEANEPPIKFPEDSFAYVLYSKEVVKGEHGDLHGPEFDRSGMNYNGGQVYSIDELEKAFPTEKILISNCRGNGGFVIKTRLGNWQIFDPAKDKVIY
jgi:hypothetical protein